MSRENVNVVLRTFRAFRERDEALFANYASDVEWDLRRYSPWTDQQLFRGHDGVRQFFRQWLADFDAYTTEASDPVDAGDRVVITVVDRAVGKPSAVPIERVHGQVWTFRQGLVVRIEIFDGRAEASTPSDWPSRWPRAPDPEPHPSRTQRSGSTLSPSSSRPVNTLSCRPKIAVCTLDGSAPNTVFANSVLKLVLTAQICYDAEPARFSGESLLRDTPSLAAGEGPGPRAATIAPREIRSERAKG